MREASAPSPLRRGRRVRFGQVHLYNNYYKLCDTPNYGYSWGVGIQSQIYAEENFFLTDTRVIGPARFLSRFNGTNLHESGTLVTFEPDHQVTDLVAAYNAVNTPELVPTVAWAPTLFTTIHSAWRVPALVETKAGATLR